jgi:hypothetical protein
MEKTENFIGCMHKSSKSFSCLSVARIYWTDSESIVKSWTNECDVKIFLTFTSPNMVLLWQLFYLFCSCTIWEPYKPSAATVTTHVWTGFWYASKMPRNCCAVITKRKIYNVSWRTNFGVARLLPIISYPIFLERTVALYMNVVFQILLYFVVRGW